jgi:SAM-dependent methyltransferase
MVRDMSGADRIRASYDAVAADYDAHVGGELVHKPLDRALLLAVADLAAGAVVADLGCGPGHVARLLAEAGAHVIGVDLSERMLGVARRHGGGPGYVAGSMLALPFGDGALAGAVLMYSVIHLDAAGRSAAFGELRRCLRPGGVALVAVHVESADAGPGQANHLTSWFGHDVDLDAHFIDSGELAGELAASGLRVTGRLLRDPIPDVEFPSRRCYLLARRG